MTKEKEKIFVKLIDMLKSIRVIFLIFMIFISYIVVFGFHLPFMNSGVVVNSVAIGSAANKAGMEFDQNVQLLNLEKITYLDNKEINTLTDFYGYIDTLNYNSTLNIRTNKNFQGYDVLLENIENKTIFEIIGLNVRDAPKSNIKLGIELEGGSRLILKPQTNLSTEQFDMLVSNLQNRLDVYGASGTKVNKLEDAFSKEKFVIIESTSSNKNDIFDLISRQGEFDAKIGNVTVFTGDNVLKVFTDPTHSGLQQCSNTQDGFICTYAFSIEIDSEGGNKFFEETSKLNVVGTHLSEKISFHLDGTEITALSIASTFKYNKITNPQITVSGNAMSTELKAKQSGQKEMKMLQTILSTQSLPSKLDVVQSYSISSSTGSKFLENALIVGFAALLLVASIVALRYRHFGIFIGIFIALITEVIIVFGVAAFLRLAIDLSAIGGLIAAIGTGVDDQIIITDEYFRKQNDGKSSRKKIKSAFYIIMIAYLTTLAAMLPLMFAGLKMLQGFAFMILIGVTVGVFITRPAYAVLLRVIMTTKAERRAEEADELDE